MRKPIEKAAKVLLRIPKSKRWVQTTSTRDQSVAVQSNHPSPRALPVEPLPVPGGCPFKAHQSAFNAHSSTAAIERELGSLTNGVGHESLVDPDLLSELRTDVHGGRQQNIRTDKETSTIGATTTTAEAPEVIKPFSQIPSPRGLPIVGTFFDFLRAGGSPELHEYTLQRHTQLGPIYKENLGGSILFVADPGLFKDVSKYEGNYPASFKPDAFQLYNKVNSNKITGLFVMEGKTWWDFRKQANKSLLKGPPELHPGMLSSYEEFMTSVLKEWEVIAQNNAGRLLRPEFELSKLGYVGLGHILFGKSFTPNWKKLNADVATTLHNTINIVDGMRKLLVFPPALARKLKSKAWTDFETSFDYILKETKDLTALCIDDLKLHSPDEGYTQGGLLYKISKDSSYSRQNLIDVFSGLSSPVDPPAITMKWVLWTLGRYPEVQDKIYDEIQNVCGPGTTVQGSHLNNLSFVKMVLKESLRLKPTAPFLARLLPTDCVIGGYNVPAGQLVTLSIYASHRNPKYFPDPEEFWPERWSRIGRGDPNGDQSYASLAGVTDPVAYIPFGLGKRSCVGKVVGRSMLHLFIARVVQTFKIESEDVKCKMRAILVPDKPLSIRLTKR